MAEEETEQELEEVKKRRKDNLGQVIKNVTNWQFVLVAFLIVLIIFLWKTNAEKWQIWGIGIAIVGFIFFFAKKSEQKKLITAPVAIEIGREFLENKKEKLEIPTDATFTPTFCFLRERAGVYIAWHLGFKAETTDGWYDYWRVDVHPYEAIIIGHAQTEFTGTELPNIVVAKPTFFYEEK